MQIDFHYGVVYVLARLAGMQAQPAEIVARACQYVDDSADSAVWEFARRNWEWRAQYGSTAVGAASYAQNPLSWPAFHFVPGGEGRTLEEKMICRPNSPPAVAALQRAIEARGSDTGLHRLGVSLHSYVDTWAHQQFSGIPSLHNVVLFLAGDDCDAIAWTDRLRRTLNTAGITVAALTVDILSRLGHGAALNFPDMPWMKWHYRNVFNERIERDNLREFMAAADMAYRAIRGYLNGNVSFDREPGLPANARAALEEMLRSNRERNGRKRLAAIHAAVARGTIPGLSEEFPSYSASGPGSWEHVAREIVHGRDGATSSRRREMFEHSHHRKVLSAILQHRLDLITDILPAHNIVFS